jgi:hypothetical protein
MSPTAAAAAAILARWAKGWRFAPQPEPDGKVAFPPGFKPAPWSPAYRMSPAQAAALAETRLNAIALQAKAGPLSRRKQHFNPD